MILQLRCVTNSPRWPRIPYSRPDVTCKSPPALLFNMLRTSSTPNHSRRAFVKISGLLPVLPHSHHVCNPKM